MKLLLSVFCTLTLAMMGAAGDQGMESYEDVLIGNRNVSRNADSDLPILRKFSALPARHQTLFENKRRKKSPPPPPKRGKKKPPPPRCPPPPKRSLKSPPPPKKYATTQQENLSPPLSMLLASPPPPVLAPPQPAQPVLSPSPPPPAPPRSGMCSTTTAQTDHGVAGNRVGGSGFSSCANQVINPEECCTMCQENALCFGFFYERADCSALGGGIDVGVCWLIADAVATFPQVGATAGTLYSNLPFNNVLNVPIVVPASEGMI